MSTLTEVSLIAIFISQFLCSQLEVITVSRPVIGSFEITGCLAALSLQQQELTDPVGYIRFLFLCINILISLDQIHVYFLTFRFVLPCSQIFFIHPCKHL